MNGEWRSSVEALAGSICSRVFGRFLQSGVLSRDGDSGVLSMSSPKDRSSSLRGSETLLPRNARYRESLVIVKMLCSSTCRSGLSYSCKSSLLLVAVTKFSPCVQLKTLTSHLSASPYSC